MATLSITWTLRHHGWAFCTISDGETQMEAVASSATGGPEQLLRAVADLASQQTATRAEFEAEPTVYRWLFHRDGNQVDVRLLEAADYATPDDGGTVLWSSRQTIDSLAHAVIQAFDTTVNELGEDAYQSQWGRRFPHAELETLRAAWNRSSGATGTSSEQLNLPNIHDN